ncbi:hypothetical protein [Plesiomonas sp. ZOR0011]|uniref:hypothetical protein n=1 Tax=Plesiomonas sp. ZOR0011 TaxID=1339230 RepID=UPI000646C694|nr:hypothetical protein [Plesiomonas sp. ZOR0011]
MTINFIDIIRNLSDNASDSAKFAKDSLGAANEAYHLQKAIKEHGEDKVHQVATSRLQKANKERNMTYSEASIEISGRIRGMLEATQGVKLFKETRDELNGGENPAPSSLHLENAL